MYWRGSMGSANDRAAAADLMRVNQRQTHRLLKRYCNGGAPSRFASEIGQVRNNQTVLERQRWLLYTSEPGSIT
jgi:hypothetical protein